MDTNTIKMKEESIIPADYRAWLDHIKSTIRSTQIKAALSVNQGLIRLYWALGKMIDDKTEQAQWGEGIIKLVASDLKEEFPNLTGFSRSNLFYMRQFYNYYCESNEKVQQLVGQIPRSHNILIFTKAESVETAVFYLQSTIKNNWLPYTTTMLCYY